MWFYKDKEIDTVDDLPEDSVGFVYLVEHIPTGRKYIGKKALYHSKKLPPLKGKKRSRRVLKESDWKTYFGSNLEVRGLVKEGKTEEFKRVMLKVVNSKKLLTYFETKYLFINEVLEPGNEHFFNDNIAGKFYRKDFINIIS